jgi:uncharacterized protein YndB with AHSA1/START domain
MSNDESRTLRIERIIRAPVQEVYDAWVVPEKLASWFGPEGYDIPEYSLDVRPGGRWRTVMRAPTGERPTVSGVYRTIEKNRRLVFSWAWDQEDGSRGPETEVTVTFEPAGKNTKLTLVQKIFVDEESRNNHNKGWNSSLNDLERVLKKAA